MEKVDNYLKALVIGGSSEIGVETITFLHDKNYNVHFTYYNNEQKKDELLSFLGNNGKAFKVNLSSFEDVNLFIKIIADFYYDVIIYCPGENPCTLCNDLSQEDVLRISQINFLSPSVIFNRLTKNMLVDKNVTKKIVYISSIAARKAAIGDSIYGATKIAMERYLSSLSLELARFNIRTLCVAPGFVDTKMMHKCREIAGVSVNDIIRSIPGRKVLQSKEVSEVIELFICDKIITTGNTITIGHGENVF